MPNLTPISELPLDLNEQCNVAWQVDPGPYVDSEAIGMAVGAVQGILRTGGLGRLVIRSYQGEKSEFDTTQVSFTGINQGVATGSVSAVGTKVELHHTDLQAEGLTDGILRPLQWPTAVVYLNKAEISSRTATDMQRGKSREAAWAKNTGRFISAGVAAAARKHLVTTAIKNESLVLCGLLLAESELITTGYELHGTAGALGSAIALASLFNGSSPTYSKLHTGSWNVNRMRFSFSPWPGFEPDRFAQTYVRSKFLRPLRLIK